MTRAPLATILVVLLMLAAWPRTSLAYCTLSGGKETVTMTVPSTITLDPSVPVGTVLATSTLATPNPSNSSVNCSFGTTTIGVVNQVGGQAGNSTTFATGVSGVGYRIMHPDSSYYLPAYGSDSIDSGTYTLSVGSTLQLVKTGPITSGATLNSGLLGYWQYAGFSSNVRAEDFVLGNSVTFVAPTCSVSTPSIAVTLPTVSNTSLSTVGATAGTTAFTIGLDCPSASAGRTINIQFDTNKSYGGDNGVITPTGSSKNVGVQIADSNFIGVIFGTPALAGNALNGPTNFTYYARYYATGAVTGGSVKATASFTITYP